MITMITEQEEIRIINDALEKFREATGLTVEIIGLDIKGTQKNYYPDARINIKWENLDFHFAIEAKKNVTRATLGGTLHQIDLFQEKAILVTRYVNPQIADQLKEMDMPFMDTVGNVYINEPPLLVFIKGNKLVGKHRDEQPTLTFRPAGLQVIFALLCQPGVENEPYREIAKKADVALGTVGWIMYDLRRMNYLVDVKRGNRRLIRKADLLNKWATAYPERLRPKEILGKYKTENNDWWKNVDLLETGALWGGEVAAYIMTKYLKPHIITLYAKPPIGRLALKYRLQKDDNGNIEILNKFWAFAQDEVQNKMVPPLLVYADLLATGDARNIETAGIIYEQELKGIIDED
jgi:hypothetical protein